jgi:hypothetical protein
LRRRRRAAWSLVYALLLVPRGYTTEYTDIMEGLLTHVAKADCFLTLPHPALECGIVTAWWRGMEAEPARPDEDGQ